MSKFGKRVIRRLRAVGSFAALAMISACAHYPSTLHEVRPGDAGARCEAGDVHGCQDVLLELQDTVDYRGTSVAYRLRADAATRGCQLGDGVACSVAFALDGGSHRLELAERACAIEPGTADNVVEPFGEYAPRYPHVPSRHRAGDFCFMAGATYVHAILAAHGENHNLRDVPADQGKGMTLLERGCKAGSHDACKAGLTVASTTGDEAAVREWQVAGCAVDPGMFDCVDLARRLEDGRDVPRDLDKALFLLRTACADRVQCEPLLAFARRRCSAGDSSACALQRDVFRPGGGVMPDDRAQAVHFLQKACDAGYQDACDQMLGGH